MPAEPEQSEETPDLEEIAEIMGEYRFSVTHAEDKLFENMLSAESDYFDSCLQHGLFEMARLAYSTYYGKGSAWGDWASQSISFGGLNGEKVDYVANEFRSFADQILNMTTKNRPAFQAQAINTDSLSTGQVTSSEAIIQYYYEQVYGERKEHAVVKSELLYGKAYTYLDWDKDGGPDVEIDEPVDDPEGLLPPEEATVKKTVKAGTFDIRRLYWWQVASDAFKSEHDNHEWHVVQFPGNRYNLINRYPLYARAIKETQSAECGWAGYFPGYTVNTDKDTVTVRVLLHAKTGALPEGRRVVFVGEKQVDDGPLPIDEIPLVNMMSCELDGTNHGVSDLWNLIPCQQMNNQLNSDIATNVEAFGRPPLAMFKGSEPSIDELANGQMVVFLSSPDHMPQVIAYPQVSEISIKLIEGNRKYMQALSGLNGIARGETDAAVKSGTHAALYHAMAVEAQSPRQANLDIHRERVANIILMYLKAYAMHPQLVAIAGQDERAYMKYFSQEEIAGVRRVTVKTANALLRTTAGRVQVCEMLRDWPGSPIKNPADVIELLTSGSLKPLTSPQHTKSMRAKRVAELLSKNPPTAIVDGPPDPTTGLPSQKKTVPSVPVFMTDGVEHLWAVLELLNGPGEPPEAAYSYLGELIEMWRVGDPYLTQLGLTPPPMGDPMADPNAAGPSDKDMAAVAKLAPPGEKTAMDQENDGQGAMGRIPKPAKSPMG